MKENGLERYIQGLQSLGKTLWISFLLASSMGVASEYIKDTKTSLYFGGASAVSSVVGLGCMYKNRKKISDIFSDMTNQELKDKYGLTGEIYLLK